MRIGLAGSAPQDRQWWYGRRSIGLGRSVGLTLLAVVGGGMLLVIGLMAALAPEFTAKLSVVPLLLVALLFALLARSDRALNEGLLKFWLVALLCALALWPSFLLVKSGGLPALDGRRIVVGLSLLLAIFYVASRRRVSQAARLLPAPVAVGAWLVGGYAILRMASCLASPSPLYSFVQVLWEVFYYFSLYYIGYLFFAAPASRALAMRVILWLMIGIALFACVERVTQQNLLVKLAPTNSEFSGTANSLLSARFRDGKFRAQGTFEHPLLLAEFAALAAAFATAALVWVGGRLGQRLLGAAALLSALVAAYLSGSRSALVSVAVAIGTVLVLRLFGNRSARTAAATIQMRRVAIVGVAVLGLTLALVALPYLSRGSSVGDQASAEGRLAMLKAGLPVIERSPLLGEGPGAGASLAGIKVRSDLVTLDNYLLAIVLESGVPALLLFVALLVYPVWRIFLTTTRLITPEGAFLAATGGALLGILATRAILWMPYNLSFAFLFAAMALSGCQVDRARGQVR